MLIVHPSSTCDVCLDPYTWATAANTPHAIACGHVFCLQCLMSTHPSLCPLCRKAFSPERIKKLHIDRYAADDTVESDETIQVNGFLQRIALVSGENTPEENVADVVSEVNRWLAARNANHGLCRALRMSVDSLNRSIERGLENQTMRDAIEQRDAEWERSYRRQEQDIRTSRLVEKNLLDQIEEYKLKLAHMERSLEENNSEMDRLYSEHAQLRAEVANFHSSGAPSVSVRQGRSSGTGRSSTSMSGRTQLSAATRRSRTSTANSAMTRAISEPLTAIVIPTTVEEEEPPQVHHKTPKKPKKHPVVVPGASLVKKIVPSAPESYITVHPGRRSPTFAGTRDPFSSSDDSNSSESDEVNGHRRGPPTISAPQYGYVPGVGYVPVAPSSAEIHDDNVGSQLVLYDPDQTSSQDQILFVGRGGIDTSSFQPDRNVRITPQVYPDGHRSRDINSSSTSVETITTSEPDHYISRPSASSSLSSLGLLAQPPSSIRQSAHATPRQGIHSPEPSIASWGTVPSARTSRSTSIRDLQLTGLPAPVADLDLPSQPSSLNSSLSDLRLTGFPDPTSRSIPSHEVMRSDDGDDVLPTRAVTWEDNVIPPRPEEGPYSISASHRRRREAAASRERRELDEVLTPRVRRISAEPISLGLSLSSSSTSSRHPAGAPDLNAVNQSLMRAHSDSRATPRHAHFRIASASDAEGVPRSSSRQNNSIDSVQIAVQQTAHPANGSHAVHDGSLTSTSRRNSFVAPHTDRISGPRQLPSAVQRSESHGDYNRHRRHSSLSFPYLSTGQPEDEIPDRHARVTRDSGLNGVDHAHVGARTLHENTRPASIYSMSGPSFSAPGGDSLVVSGSLGLSLAPPAGPGASAATTSSGEPSMIRAPRPVNGSHSNNIFAAWDRRTAR